MEVATEIAEAIRIAIIAGALGSAAKIDRDGEVVWSNLANDYSRLVRAELRKFADKMPAQ